MNNFFKKIVVTSVIVLPGFAMADLINCGDKGQAACNWSDFVNLIKVLMIEGVKYAILFSVIVFVVAGYTYLTSNGNESKVKKAHSMFVHVIVGLLIAMLSFLIIAALISAFGGFRNSEILNTFKLD